MIRKIAVLCACIALAACAQGGVVQDRVALPAAPPPGEPPSTIGMTADALRIAFGAPAFVRKDGNTQFWRYNGTTCHAFFFLYPQVGVLTVGHVETLPHGNGIAADINCLNSLRLQPPPAPVS